MTDQHATWTRVEEDDPGFRERLRAVAGTIRAAAAGERSRYRCGHCGCRSHRRTPGHCHQCGHRMWPVSGGVG